MSAWVVDASVAAKWLIEEPHTADALRLLAGGRILHSPDLLLIETDSMLCKRLRRGEISSDEAGQVRASMRSFPLVLHHSLLLLDGAYEIASQTGCSIYDSLYVSLAARLGEKLVTADERLLRVMAEGPMEKHVLWVANVPA
jgi:predicted nucleic acid-binding protein